MRNTLLLTTVAAGALFSSAAVAADKVPICHYDGVEYRLMEVRPNTVANHQAHGDVAPSTWWPDGDGDGYGDPAGATIPCPAPDHVENGDDCNDADPSVSPFERDTCRDGIDNDCSGVVDQLCIPTGDCPCYGADRIRETVEDWARLQLDIHEEQCVDFARPAWEHPGWEEILELSFKNYVDLEDPFESGEKDRFLVYTADWDDGVPVADQAYCYGVSSWSENLPDGTSGGAIYYAWYATLDEGQVAACRGLIEGMADELGLVCKTEPDPE